MHKKNKKTLCHPCYFAIYNIIFVCYTVHSWRGIVEPNQRNY